MLAVPSKPGVGEKTSPLNALLMFVIVPVKTNVASFTPSLFELAGVKVKPAVVESVILPLVAVKVTFTALDPASTSEMEIRLPLPVEKVKSVFLGVLCDPGTLLTGGSLTALTVIVNCTVPEVSEPPFAVPPLSFKVTETVATPPALVAGV